MFSPLDLDKIESSEINLVIGLIDDSGSIEGHEAKICNAWNVLVDELIAADGGRDKYWLGLRSFNGVIEREIAPISPKMQISPTEYTRYGWTPLFDCSYNGLSYQKSQYEALRRRGVKVRTASVVLTDGFDHGERGPERGSRHHHRDIAPLAEEMASSKDHLLFGIGISHGNVKGPYAKYVTKPRSKNILSSLFGQPKQAPTDDKGYPTEYHYVFRKQMGFSGPNAHVIAVDNTGEAIARAMRQASQSIARTGANTKSASGF